MFWSLQQHPCSDTVSLFVFMSFFPPFCFYFVCAEMPELGNDWEFLEPLEGILKIITIRTACSFPGGLYR